MFWIIFVSALTAILAILSGYLQYRENLSQQHADLVKQKELADAYQKISEKSDSIVHLQAKLEEKNEALIAKQKQHLDFFTGGDELVTVLPTSLTTEETNNYEVEIMLINNSKNPQHDIQVSIEDNFIFQSLTQEQPVVEPISMEFGREIQDQTQFQSSIKQMAPRSTEIVYKTHLPENLRRGYFLVKIKSRNGEKTQKVEYRNENGIWALQDSAKY